MTFFLYNKHEFKSKYMYLRQVCGRGHRTQEPYGSAFNALPLSSSSDTYQKRSSEWRAQKRPSIYRRSRAVIGG